MLYFPLAKRRGRNSDVQKIIYKILECFEFLCALQSQRATDLLMKPPFRPVRIASSLLPKPPDHSATPPLKHPFQRGSGVSVKRLKKYGGTTTPHNAQCSRLFVRQTQYIICAYIVEFAQSYAFMFLFLC